LWADFGMKGITGTGYGNVYRPQGNCIGIGKPCVAGVRPFESAQADSGTAP
jgi:hypothetical protein